VINRDGTGRQNISNNSCDNYTPAYAPDGTKIAFTYTKHGNQKIAIMNPNGTDQVLFISTNPNSYLEYTPRWSPDKAFMYFTLYPGTLEVYRIPYTVPADSMDQVNISNNSHHDSGADCSPDGTKIVYASNRDGNWEIYKGNPDGSGLLQKLTDTSSPESNRSPRWSPDGTRIVYENGGKIWIMNSDGTNKINIGPDSINGMNPTWSPHKE
jgi:Tol biopolymer transport system component